MYHIDLICFCQRTIFVCYIFKLKHSVNTTGSGELVVWFLVTLDKMNRAYVFEISIFIC